MAGLGESCSHVSAVLFYISYAVQLRDSKTVTEKKANWTIPNACKGIEYSEVKDIDFNSPKVMRRKLDEKCREHKGKEEQEQLKVTEVHSELVPSDHEMADLFSEIHKSGTKSSILSVIPPYSKEFIPKTLQEVFPKALSELYNKENLGKDFKELIDMAKTVDVAVTPEEVAAVEKETKKQSCSNAWFMFRAGRVTASKLHAVCKTDPAQPSLSLIKVICYPENSKFWSKQTAWGCKHEKVARNEYIKYQSKFHKNLEIVDSGLFISVKEPHLAATPDALVSCNCCGFGVLEIKCPFCIRHQFLFEAMDPQNKVNMCLTDANGKLKLKKSHPYFYQIQSQLFCTNRKYGDLFIWTEEDWHLERITFNELFFSECIVTSKAFFINSIMVEMLGKFYSRPTSTVTNESVGTSTVEETFCICEGPEDGPMLLCSNEHCKYKLFHLECLSLKKGPKRRKWYCPDCTASKEQVKMQKKKHH